MDTELQQEWVSKLKLDSLHEDIPFFAKIRFAEGQEDRTFIYPSTVLSGPPGPIVYRSPSQHSCLLCEVRNLACCLAKEPFPLTGQRSLQIDPQFYDIPEGPLLSSAAVAPTFKSQWINANECQNSSEAKTEGVLKPIFLEDTPLQKLAKLKIEEKLSAFRDGCCCSGSVQQPAVSTSASKQRPVHSKGVPGKAPSLQKIRPSPAINCPILHVTSTTDPLQTPHLDSAIGHAFQSENCKIPESEGCQAQLLESGMKLLRAPLIAVKPTFKSHGAAQLRKGAAPGSSQLVPKLPGKGKKTDVWVAGNKRVIETSKTMQAPGRDCANDNMKDPLAKHPGQTAKADVGTFSKITVSQTHTTEDQQLLFATTIGQEKEPEKTGPARKRARAADLDAGDVEIKVKEYYARDQLSKLTVNELKNFLSSRQLPVGGKKSDLIGRVQTALSLNQP
eukprot:jgi/Botrbrau1/16802/Bobra.150_2s0030.1